MTATVAPTRSAEPPREIFRGRPSHAWQAGSYGIAVLVALAAILSLFLLPPPFSLPLSGFLGAAAAFVAARGWLRILSTAYRIDTQRLEVERGVLSKRIDNLDLWRVRDLGFRQGFVQRMFGVGVIVLASSDATHPEVAVEGIRGARELYDRLRAAVDEAHARARVMAIESK